MNLESGPALQSLYCSTLMIHWGEACTDKYRRVDALLGRGDGPDVPLLGADIALANDEDPALVDMECGTPTVATTGAATWPLRELHSSARGIDLWRRLQDFVQCPTDMLPDGTIGSDGQSVEVSPFLAPDQLATFAQDQSVSDANVFQKILAYEAQMWRYM